MVVVVRRFFLVLVSTAAVLLSLAGGAWAIPAPTTLGYTGGERAYGIPSGVLVVGVAVQGAWGGESNNVGQQGEGITGYLTVRPGQTVFAEVGQNGGYDGGATFGGGGAAGAPPPTLSGANGEFASAGGGASDVRTCSIHAASCSGGGSSLGSRLIVAAGGGGFGGGGNSNSPTCAGPVMPGTADNHQTNLPNALPGGPAPVVTAAGIVIPGFASDNHSSVMTINGTTDAAMGSATAGAGGVLAGCSSGASITYSNSVAGGSGAGPKGGTGGNASGLPPFSGGGCTGNECGDAGSGGGGGGGYFGGGGGATGYDTCSCGNDAGGGQGGAGGSSFAANQVQFPRAPGVLGNVRDVFIKFVPVIEIDAPANGAVYTPGQSVDASWSCGFDPATALGPGNNCAGTVASGSPIDTSPGTHTFSVQGKVNNNASQNLKATVTYTVRSGGPLSNTTSGHAGGLKFTLTAPRRAAAGGKLTVSVTKSGKSKAFKVVSYRFGLGRKKAALVSSKAGMVKLSLKHLSVGRHTLTVVITLGSTATHRRGPTMKAVTLKLPFTIT